VDFSFHAKLSRFLLITRLIHLAWEQDDAGIKSKLKEIIPDYQPYPP
jgi:hypothetical protein